MDCEDASACVQRSVIERRWCGRLHERRASRHGFHGRHHCW